jgi:RNA polymerase sigma-70 factor (ECF subfamily)
VEAEAEDRAFLQSVRHAIDALPPKLRETLVLCAVEGLEPADVATMIGIPQGTVRSRLHLARKALLRALSS